MSKPIAKITLKDLMDNIKKRGIEPGSGGWLEKSIQPDSIQAADQIPLEVDQDSDRMLHQQGRLTIPITAPGVKFHRHAKTYYSWVNNRYQ